MRAPAWLLVALGACGAAPPPPTTPPVTETEQPVENETDTDAYTEVHSFFGRKRPAVSQCYADALAAKKVDPKARGYVTVALVVETSGKPTNVHIAAATLKSELLEQCIVRLVGSWILPKPARPLEFTFSYNFLPE